MTKESTILIQILAVTPVQATTSTQKPYTKAEVAYKNLSFNGKVENKIIMPFGVTQAACAAMLTATPGSKWDIAIVKNDKGYNDWTSAVASNAEAPPQQAPTATAGYTRTQAGASTATTKSTYETPEERAAKQIYIVRQSSISAAINLLGVGSKTPPKVADVIETAKEFEAYVFGRESSSAKADSNDVMDMMDDIPL